MKAAEFALKHNFKNVDKDIVEKLHKDEEKTEQQWFRLFNGNIDFKPAGDEVDQQKVKEKIYKAKAIKQQSDKNK